MLIGNRHRFAFELAPVEPSWESHYAPERASWAALSIWVAGSNLCLHIRSGEEELRPALFVPLGPIADWFVRAFPGLAFEERFPWVESSPELHAVMRKWGELFPPREFDEESWLDLREDFWNRHFLLAGADGARLPNLALLRQDEEVRLVWARPPSSETAGLTFVNAEGSAVVPWNDAVSVMSAFVEEVARAFRAKRVTAYEWLAKPPPLLHALLAEGSLGPVVLYCARPLEQLAKLLGVSHAEVAGVLGVAMSSEPAGSPLCQILRDLPPHPSQGVGQESLETVEASRAGTVRLESLRNARSHAIDAARASASPVEAGLLAARAVRRLLKLDGQPIGALEEVLELFGITCRNSSLEAQREQMLVAAAAGHQPAATILRTPQTVKPWGRRFEQARALGHALLDPLRADALGAASTKWCQDVRRRRSGAFAAELLLPRAALEPVSQGHLDSETTIQGFEDVLERYGVGATTAAFQFYNHKLLSKPARDELIKRFASDSC